MHFYIKRSPLLGAATFIVSMIAGSLHLSANAVGIALGDKTVEAFYRYNGAKRKLFDGENVDSNGSIQVIRGKVTITCADGSEEVTSQQAKTFKKIAELGKCINPSNKSLGEELYPKGKQGIDTPYLISPRYTLLSSNRPTFRWKHVKNSTNYVVQLYAVKAGYKKSQPWGEPLIIDASSPQEHVQNLLDIEIFSLDYPDRELLQKGVKYHLVVQANVGGKTAFSHESGDSQYNSLSGISTSRPIDGKVDLQFKLSEKQALLGHLPETAQVNELDRLGFHDEAIQILEKLIITKPSPSLYRRLALLYAKIGLEALSRQSLQESINKLVSLRNKEECEVEVKQIQQVLPELKIPQRDTLKCN
jgi:hypothetical protein